MCEFCTRHGEGKKWYENAVNYSAELFFRVNSPENLRSFLENFRQSLGQGVRLASRLKRRLPWIYNLLVYPRVSCHLQKTHFGQVVPLEDVERILEKMSSIVRLPCVCRRVTTGEKKRYCFGIGLDLTSVYRAVPDFSEFERWPVERAREFIRRLDGEGKIHSVWTFNTPFIGALCNCDRDCMAYRSQHTLGIARTMWKAEYLARIDPLLCTGCNRCLSRCCFDAIVFDRGKGRCVIEMRACFGCGVCRPVCQHGAIRLVPRESVPAAVAGGW